MELEMLRGHIDSVTSLGFVEGWATDPESPTRTVNVVIRANGAEVARGLALAFREDLMNAGLGLGWCAFRLRLDARDNGKPTGLFELVEGDTGDVMCSTHDLPFRVDDAAPLTSLESLVSADPTVIGGLWQLRKCEALFTHFIQRRGIETFIDAAYAYVLGRAADPTGRLQYTRCIRQANLSPMGVLEALANSDEFRGKNRQLAAPKSPAFPFV
jgi:hypothetical protein